MTKAEKVSSRTRPASEALTITAIGGESLVGVEITTLCGSGIGPLIEVEGLGGAIGGEDGHSDSVNVSISIIVVVRPLFVEYRV